MALFLYVVPTKKSDTPGELALHNSYKKTAHAASNPASFLDEPPKRSRAQQRKAAEEDGITSLHIPASGMAGSNIGGEAGRTSTTAQIT